jgi:hypothetical protein
MMPRPELRRWLSDAAAQRATADSVVAVGKQLKTLPFIRQLHREVDALSDGTADAALACARRAMADEDGLAQVFSHMVEAAAADPYYRPIMRSVSTPLHSGIMLFDHRALNLYVSIIPAEALAAKRLARDGSRSIVFPGHRSLHKFIRAGGATLSFWEAPPIEAGFTSGGSGRCRLVERRRIADGELLDMHGGRQSYVIEHASSDIVYLQAAASAGRAPLTVEYDSDSFEFVGASSTDEVSSRTQMMLALLRTMERTDAVPVMTEMLNSPHFYARWQAMRELLALDAEAALPHLDAMAARDPHPEVRSAAAATLAACFPGAAEAANLVLEVN